MCAIISFKNTEESNWKSTDSDIATISIVVEGLRVIGDLGNSLSTMLEFLHF